MAALISHGFGPVQAMHLKVAAGESFGEDLRLGRGWSEDEWASAGHDLRLLGFLDADGRLTRDGAAARDDVEAVTDAVAAQPWTALDLPAQQRAVDLLTPLTQAVWASGVLPVVNPIGVPPTT
jgi:hypothetical protein